MVEPPTPVADPDVSEGFAALVEFAGSIGAGSGAAGLAALQQLMELAPHASAAAGAAFVEYGQDGARLVAAAGVFEWLRGRPMSLSRPMGPSWVAGPRLREYERSVMQPDAQRQLAMLGIDRVVKVAVVVGGRHTGCVVLGYREGAPPVTQAQRSVAGLLAACGTTLYALGAGLPVHGAPTGVDDGSARGDDRNLFIAVTSHELRTPVTVIKGYADTLTEHWDQLDEETRRSAVAVIGHRSRDLGRLLDRLLSTAGDGIRPADQVVGAPFNLADAVRTAVADLPADLHRVLRTALPARVPMALGDRGSIATIVTELVTNADKYSPDEVDVELTVGADPTAVWLRVADRGVGIRPEHVERAFERFWQLDPDERLQPGGVGLGLYLVRRLVERHRGWVSLRPRRGGGTVAEVRLPRADTTPGEA